MNAFTGALAAFTLLLVVVAGVQIGLFVWQLKLIRKSLIDSRLRAKAALRNTKLAERAYSNLERPYVYVFGAHKLEMDSSVVQGVIAFAKYSVANYGKTPAKIENAWAQISTSEEGFPESPTNAERTHWLLRSPVLAPGERRDEITEHAPYGLNAYKGEIGEVTIDLDKNSDLFFQVVVSYRGPFTSGHETSACWVFDRLTNRFIQFDDDEYNYEK